MKIIGYETVTVTEDGVSVSRLIWRKHLRPMPGLVEITYDANPGLAAHGTLLPRGTSFILPIPEPRAEPTIGAIRLWG